MELSQEVKGKLETGKNIWLASVRSDGRPHLVPVWFVWLGDKVFLSIDPTSVKARNISGNANVALALEDGSSPVICEGEAHLLSPPLPEEVTQRFFSKYGWEILKEKQYNQLVEVRPKKLLFW